MAKRIIEEAPSEYKTTCSKCGTRFAYTLEDVRGYFGMKVNCPKCGDECFHWTGKL